MKIAAFLKTIGALSFTLLATQAHAQDMMGLNLKLVDGEVLSNCSITSPAPIFCKSTEGVVVSEKLMKSTADRIAEYNQTLKEYRALQNQISELEKPQSSSAQMMDVRDINTKKSELARMSLGLYINPIPMYNFKLFEDYTNGLEKTIIISKLGSKDMHAANIFFDVHYNATMGMNLLIIKGEEKTLASCVKTQGPIKVFGITVPGSMPQLLCTLANNRGFLRFEYSQ